MYLKERADGVMDAGMVCGRRIQTITNSEKDELP